MKNIRIDWVCLCILPRPSVYRSYCTNKVLKQYNFQKSTLLIDGNNWSVNFKVDTLSILCKPVLEISINHKCYSICYSKFECKYTHIHTYTQKHSHTYIQTYSHTHTHTHTHIYVHKYSYCTYLNFAKMAIEFGIIKSHAI